MGSKNLDFDPIGEYLKYKYNDKSIFILEEIMSKNWYETIVHFGNEAEESFYEIITYDRLDKFEMIYNRKYKLKKITDGIK